MAFIKTIVLHLTSTDNMSEFIKNATDLIEQGHVRVGTEVVKDPAFLVSRTLEDFVTWVDSSKIRRHVMEYNNMVGNLCIVLLLYHHRISMLIYSLWLLSLYLQRDDFEL